MKEMYSWNIYFMISLMMLKTAQKLEKKSERTYFDEAIESIRQRNGVLHKQRNRRFCWFIIYGIHTLRAMCTYLLSESPTKHPSIWNKIFWVSKILRWCGRTYFYLYVCTSESIYWNLWAITHRLMTQMGTVKVNTAGTTNY